MQDPSDSMETVEPDEGDRSGTGGSFTAGDPAPGQESDPSMASTALVEVLPGVAVVFGEVPAELNPDLIDFGIVPAADRLQISTVLASIGNASTVAGGLANAFASAQGLYRLSSATQSLLKTGATLAVKDGANLGTVMVPGRFIAQARFIPVTTVSAAQTAAALGPALAMVALQMQLSEITGLVRTNIELTRQVLATVRKEQRSELTGLVETIARAVEQARELRSVPLTLWENVAGSEAALRKQLELYRGNVAGHIEQIDRSDPRRRREYLQTNAEAVAFDAFALLDCLKAWVGYKALQAGRARDAGRDDAAEAQLVNVIMRDTREEFDSVLAGTTSLVSSLTQELRFAALLPGREPLSQSLPGKRKEAKAAREISARLLEAIEPLADALQPPALPLDAPDVVCAPESPALDPYLRILRWLFDDDETLRALGFPDQLDSLGPISAIFGGARDKLSAARDKTPARTLVAVTNRRIITAKTNAFLEQGEIRQDIPINQVRYVRAAAAPDKSARSAIDLITRDENISWVFSSGVDNVQVEALAAVLAESMMIPDAERDALQRGRHIPIESAGSGDSSGMRSTAPTASEAEARDAG
ncbi:hypothetical protein [Streptomyces diastaticus]|uniref:hypothetical protein n=1 Tax=Streptomyces diastaticus TaxID=1956 RepID=UPI0033FD50FD